MRVFGCILMMSLLMSMSLSGQELITPGDKNGDGKLLMPNQIEEGPDGLIYVYDRMDSSIKVFSPEGTYLRKLGRAGINSRAVGIKISRRLNLSHRSALLRRICGCALTKNGRIQSMFSKKKIFEKRCLFSII